MSILDKLLGRKADRVSLEGEVIAIRWNPKLPDYGLYVAKKKNVILNEGIGRVSGLLNGEVSGYYDYIAIGTSDATASASDTSLHSEIDRGLATTSQETTSITNDTAKWVKTFSFTATYTINEVGICRGTSDDFLTRANLSVTVNDGDNLTIIYKVKVQSA